MSKEPFTSTPSIPNRAGRLASFGAPLDLILHVHQAIQDLTSSRGFYLRPSLHHLRKSILGLVRAFLYALVPQIVRTHYFKDTLPTPTNPSSTTWMNGIRGLAAWTVFNLHYVYAFQYDIVLGYWTRPDIHSYFYQIPPIPILYDGTIAVQMFFTIAGYVCSYRSLQIMTNQRYEELFTTLPATVFRRFFRLYLPAMTSMFCISVLAYCGAYEPTRHYFDDPAQRKHYFPGPMGEIHPKRFPTMALQMQEWWKQVSKLGNVWIEFNDGPILDWHLWTIIAEFRASMHLFIALLAFARCKPYARIFWLALLGYIEGFQWPHNECVPFFAGAIIAQLDVLRKQSGITPSKSEGTLYILPKSIRGSIRLLVYIVALYAMCYPVKGLHHPSWGYAWMNSWIPSTYGRPNGFKLPRQFGCAILFYLLTTVPEESRGQSIWHRLCTSKIALYMGSIMFGLYLVHGIVLHLIGYALPLLIWARIGGNDDKWRFLGGLFFAYLVALAICLWVADVWTREVEGRLNRLTKWLENLCFERL